MAKHNEFIVKNSEELLGNEYLFTMVQVHNEQHRIQDQEKTGMALPGTALQVPAMMVQAKQQPPPGMPQIYGATMQKMQADMQNAKQAQQNPNKAPTNKAPQAPASPAPVGSKGPPQTTASAPSQNTPQGGANANPA